MSSDFKYRFSILFLKILFKLRFNFKAIEDLIYILRIETIDKRITVKSFIRREQQHFKNVFGP